MSHARGLMTVNCSPTAKSLPIRVGLREGIFAR